MDLPKSEKILYKFVVNDQWIIDPEAPQEDDGHGNVNNVLHPEQIKPRASMVPEAVTTSSAAPESTTAALAGQVPLEPKKEATQGKIFQRDLEIHADRHFFTVDDSKSSVPGTFPETPATEKDAVSVNPLPPTGGAGNPINVPAGEPLPPTGDVTTNTTHSAVTTSQEDYEKAGSSIPIIGGALAALGLGGAVAAKKEENLIPESSLPMGEGAGTSLDAGPTISSAAPESTTAALAGQVPLEEKKPATETATSSTVPEVVKESIADAHTDPEATTSSEAVKEKAEVEQELLKKVPETEEAGEPAPTIAAATSAAAPSATAPSGETVPGASSTAAAAVADGADGAAEPTEVPKTTVAPEKTEADNTEYAPPHASSAAPGEAPAAAAAVSDGAEDPTLLNEPAVQMMNKNDAEASEKPGTEPTTAAAATTTETPKVTEPTPAAAEPKKEETKATTPASSASTPAKKAETSTPTSTPGSTSKEKKKKHRVSSFFKKIFD